MVETPFTQTLVPGAQRPAGVENDALSAEQWLTRFLGDDGGMAALRSQAQALGDGLDWSRGTDHEVAQHLAFALVAKRWATPPVVVKLLHFAPLPGAAVPPPAPTPAAAPGSRPSAAPSATPPPAETMFGPNLNVAAMVATLQAAARDGVPFCEECAKAAVAKQEEATA